MRSLAAGSPGSANASQRSSKGALERPQVLRASSGGVPKKAWYRASQAVVSRPGEPFRGMRAAERGSGLVDSREQAIALDLRDDRGGHHRGPGCRRRGSRLAGWKGEAPARSKVAQVSHAKLCGRRREVAEPPGRDQRARVAAVRTLRAKWFNCKLR